MAETPEGAWRCAYCSTPIIVEDKIVEVDGALYCCPNCELMSQRPEAAKRARRGGGLVLSCNQCGTPIFFPEILVSRGTHSYCCLNCAEVARLNEAAPALAHA